MNWPQTLVLAYPWFYVATIIGAVSVLGIGCGLIDLIIERRR
jgi:hypothetical protein